MTLNKIFALLIGLLLISAAANAGVPNKMSYQGRLTDNSGQPVPDAAYAIEFRIYADSGISVIPPLWAETQTVMTSSGLFNVVLGTSNPLDRTIFDGTVRYLALKVGTDPELSPRTPLLAVPYALVAETITETGLECSSCENFFVKNYGPDSMSSASDTTFTVLNLHDNAQAAIAAKVAANSSDSVGTIRAYALNNGTGEVTAGSFYSVSGGTAPVFGLKSVGVCNNTFTAQGMYGLAGNDGTGASFGGVFESRGVGSGVHVGVSGFSSAAVSNQSIGVLGSTYNSGPGSAYGGWFEAEAVGGTGARIGVKATSEAAGDSAAYGVHAKARNSGGGSTFGAYFEADSSGSHSFMVGAQGIAQGDQQTARGLVGNAYNNSAVYSSIGASGVAFNYGGGSAIGGSFTGLTVNGIGAGVYGYSSAASGSQEQAIGVIGSLSSGTVTDKSYAGRFENYISGGTQYGVYALAEDLSGLPSAFGVYGRCNHGGNGNGYGGYFLSDSTGTGISYGGRTVGLSKGTAAAYGIASYAATRGSGAVYGGYFEAENLGTGTKYGIYARSISSTGYAGYFNGNVRITGDFVALGTKSAAVAVDNDQYRLVYCQESTENWFEDIGEGKLVNGRVHIELDPIYLQMVTIDDANPIKVFIQLNDPDCNGTAVIRGKTGFDVVELQNGTGQASFSYRVMAKRRGYESNRMELMPGLTPTQTEAQLEREMQNLRVDDIKQSAKTESVGKQLQEAEAATASAR